MSRSWSQYQVALFNDFATNRGHTVVEAVAGSGKTSSLIEGMKHVPAGKRVVMIAFNRSTASELKARVPAGVDAKTSHGLGYGAVLWAFRSQFPQITVDDKKEYKLAKQMFSDWSSVDIDALLKLTALAKAWVARSERELTDICVEYDLPSGLVRFARDLLAECAKPSATLSFDDMVWLPVVLNLRPKQYDVVVVDEAQDLSRAQVMLAKMAVKRGGRIVAVGDPKQAIYGFRGADSRSMPNMTKDLRATVLPLSVTYRCPVAVVDHVKHLVPQLEAAPGAAEGVVNADVATSTMTAKWAPGDFVLSRVNAPLVRLCLAALRGGIPAYVLGRDIGAGLRALVNKCARGESVPDMLAGLRRWRDDEEQRLVAADQSKKIDAMMDRFDTIVALSEDMRSVSELLARLDSLFADDARGKRLMFSSTHKAKGLEAHRVWLLAPTYREGLSEEEDNLYYVAATRAQHELNLVDYDPKRDM